jgi:predicted nucleotidyltransferase
MVKLLDALRDRPSVALRRHRDQVLDAAQRNRVSNVRVFGSVAYGTDGPGSDVDLLVTPLDGATALDLAGFMVDVQDILEAPVDVISDRGRSPFLDRVRQEAEPL